MATTDHWVSRAFAKINLGLFVHGKRSDGYHDIETGFVYIDWADTIRIRPAKQTNIHTSDPDLRVDDQNTVVKAYKLFAHEFGLSQSYDIHIEKVIPQGAGLGGGSTDAAALLRMLNKIEGKNIHIDRLMDTAALIGADVPFFLMQSTAIGVGTGTQLHPVDIQPDAWILTVYPNFQSSTADAYRYCEPNEDHELKLESILRDIELDEWSYLLSNDLEPSVMVTWPMVGDLKDQMIDFGAVYSAMSGSGSSVFGLFEQDFVALNAWHAFTDLGFRCNLTRPRFQPDQGVYIEEA